MWHDWFNAIFGIAELLLCVIALCSVFRLLRPPPASWQIKRPEGQSGHGKEKRFDTTCLQKF